VIGLCMILLGNFVMFAKPNWFSGLRKTDKAVS